MTSLVLALLMMSTVPHPSPWGPVVARDVAHDRTERVDVGAPPRVLSETYLEGEQQGSVQNRLNDPPDSSLQSVTSDRLPPSPNLSFEGIGAGIGSLGVVVPPDANAAIGIDQIVEVVNFQWAVFRKADGKLLLGPTSFASIWNGFPGICGAVDAGDPTATFDSRAQRWILSHMAWRPGDAQGQQCVAVSESPDATRAWFRYQFATPSPNDFTKIAVWTDAYVMSTVLLTTAGGSGPWVCALERSAMLQGSVATQQCFKTDQGQPLPAHLTGGQLPPPGSPAYLVDSGLFDDTVGIYTLSINWTNPPLSVLGPRLPIPVAARSYPCNVCIRQPGTAQGLDSLSRKVGSRAPFRIVGGAGSVLLSETVDTGNGTGIRWYQIDVGPQHQASLQQQGTFSVAGADVWQPAIASDAAGGIALSFNTSSAVTYPSIQYAGRTSSDPPGVMPLGVGEAYPGTAAQLSNDRWGDYSSLEIDPVDDCTFWSTSQYAGAQGPGTRISAFKMPGCDANDLISVSADPPVLSLNPSGEGYTQTRVTLVQGQGGKLRLSVEGLPEGVRGEFQPPLVEPGGTSDLVLRAGSAAKAGTALPFLVVATSPSGRGVSVLKVTVPAGVRGSGAPGTGCREGGAQANALLGMIALFLRSRGRKMASLGRSRPDSATLGRGRIRLR